MVHLKEPKVADVSMTSLGSQLGFQVGRCHVIHLLQAKSLGSNLAASVPKKPPGFHDLVLRSEKILLAAWQLFIENNLQTCGFLTSLAILVVLFGSHDLMMFQFPLSGCSTASDGSGGVPWCRLLLSSLKGWSTVFAPPSHVFWFLRGKFIPGWLGCADWRRQGFKNMWTWQMLPMLPDVTSHHVPG